MRFHEWNVTISRRYRKTISWKIEDDGRITVASPAGLSDSEIMQILEKHIAWFRKHMPEKTDAAQEPPIPIEEVRALAEKALKVIPGKTRRFAEMIGVCYSGITIRNQKTRWGSCSSKGHLNFNCLLMLAPENVLNCVIVHELCHLKEMNHSPRFYALMDRYIPDRKACEEWLGKEGKKLIRRMLAGSEETE